MWVWEGCRGGRGEEGEECVCGCEYVCVCVSVCLCVCVSKNHVVSTPFEGKRRVVIFK